MSSENAQSEFCYFANQTINSVVTDQSLPMATLAMDLYVEYAIVQDWRDHSHALAGKLSNYIDEVYKNISVN